MLSSKTVSALTEARRHCTADVWKQLAERIALLDDYPTRESIARITSALSNPHTAWLISEALLSALDIKWAQIAGAMVAADHFLEQNSLAADFIWTGPANGRFPVRRIDQVLYDLIAVAERQILLVTFAAHRIEHLCRHLLAAVMRGVALTLIVEREDESEGQLSVNALHAFNDLPLNKIKVLYWPIENRLRNKAGRPGKLHVKCAIVDDTAIVGSANFTDDAFTRNMELGVIIHDPGMVDTLLSHFNELQRKGVLRVLKS